jgi:hypothetical protein
MTTPPRIPFPGPVQTDDGLDFDPAASVLPTQPGQWRYAAGRFWAYDAIVGAFSLAPPDTAALDKLLLTLDGVVVVTSQGNPLFTI